MIQRRQSTHSLRAGIWSNIMQQFTDMNALSLQEQMFEVRVILGQHKPFREMSLEEMQEVLQGLKTRGRVLSEIC